MHAYYEHLCVSVYHAIMDLSFIFFIAYKVVDRSSIIFYRSILYILFI